MTRTHRPELARRGRMAHRFCSMGLGSAPGDRPGVVGESPIRRRSSDLRRPRAVRVWPRGQGRSVGRGTCRPAIEPRKGTVNLGRGLAERAGRIGAGMTPAAKSPYAGYRFPGEVISHAVWLYFRFPLSLRMVEEM